MCLINRDGEAVLTDKTAEITSLQAELAKCQAALIDSRAEYLNTLAENPDCSAWTFDEQTPERQAELRKQACETLEMGEPIMMMQLERQGAYISKLEKAYLLTKQLYQYNLIEAEELGRHYAEPMARWRTSAEKGERARKEAKDALEKIRKS